MAFASIPLSDIPLSEVVFHHEYFPNFPLDYNSSLIDFVFVNCDDFLKIEKLIDQHCRKVDRLEKHG